MGQHSHLLVALLAVAGCNHEGPANLEAPDIALEPQSLIDAAVAPDLVPSTCRRIVVEFTPAAANLQIVVWLEDARGQVIDTLFVTEATGRRGLGNRPGAPLLGSTTKFPQGRREMVAPVWAHRRNHAYPRVVMGGACPYGPAERCPGTAMPCGGDCDERAWAYVMAKTWDDFYCWPLLLNKNLSPVTCAPSGQTVKGHYADPPAASLYPPRADITPRRWDKILDSPDVLLYAADNDLVAVTGATPAANEPVKVTSTWDTSNRLDGTYHIWVEVSAEGDFNAPHHYPGDFGPQPEWFFELADFLGQPSILYHCGFTTAPLPLGTFPSYGYSGYGSWDGSDGMLRPPDNTISSDRPGSGALRLMRGEVRVTSTDCQ